MSSRYLGKCYCGAISWSAAASAVNFTSLCHCRDCQTVTGSSYGSTSLMIYDPCGVKFSGDKPNVYHSKSEQGNATQRGFCGTCGSVLFNHVSEGKSDEHWAMRTGSLITPPTIDKEIFMKSKPDWVPSLLGQGQRFQDMPPS